MKKFYLLLFALGFTAAVQAQASICNPSGNIMIYSNYDGGELNINVDQNIPNLKIGIVSYEFVHITISGTYAGNVTEVRWVGYNASNNNCNIGGPFTTTISGVPNNVDTIINIPAATYNNANGYSYIICNYSCDNQTNQGGCNTPDQIVDYFQTVFGGTLFAHYTQYNCWLASTTYNVSAGGNCCIVPTTTAIKEDSKDAAALSVSPNPSSGKFTVNFDASAESQQIEIRNALGEVVKTVTVAAGESKTEISLEDQPAGMYFVIVHSAGMIKKIPLIIGG